jgi:Tfp pilus assembly protein PilF
VEALQRGLALKLEQVQGPFREALRLLEAGEGEAARENFHQAFRSLPQLAQECVDKAAEWLRGDEPERALAELDRALASNPRYPDLHNLRGLVLCELESFDEAFAAFRRAAALCPDHHVPPLNLAFALLRAGHTAEAEEQLTAILARDGGEPVARAKLEELRAIRSTDRRGHSSRS